MTRINPWLSEAIANEAAILDAGHLPGGTQPSAQRIEREKAARKIIADAGRKIARLEQALDEGLAVKTFVRLTAKHEEARDAAKAALERYAEPEPHGLTPAQFRAALQHASALAEAISNATDDQRQQLYSALGLELRYDGKNRVLHALAQPRPPAEISGWKRGVGGGT